MCRLFGMTGGTAPLSAEFWLLDAPDSLSAQSHRDPDGTGIGTFDSRGHPVVHKAPIAAFGDAAFARDAQHERSTTFLAHIRHATTGGLTMNNTHPFEQDGRLFAHNGMLEGLAELESELGDDLALVKGETDSERLFALITRETRRNGGDVEAGIVAATTWAAEHVPVYALNLIVTTDSELFALRYPATHTLYVLDRAAGGHQGGRPLHHQSSLGTRVRSDDAIERPVVVVASERLDDDPGWRPLASGELIRVDAQLGITSAIVLPDPPAHVADALTIRVADPAEPEAQHCLAEYAAELGRRFDGGFDPALSTPTGPDDLRPPAGLLLVATRAGEPVGCGALRFHGDDPPEIKRVWVDASARGLGLGRRLLAELERRAADAGARVVRLDTNRALVEAIALYRSAGYREIDRFSDERYAHHWFEKTVSMQSGRSA